MSKKAPAAPNSAQLVAALEHVHYEIEQLTELHRSMPTKGRIDVQNACVESAVIHVAILVHFFDPASGQRNPDDVLAEHYGFSSRKIAVDGNLVQRRNKEVAHLTYTRAGLRPDQWRWDLAKLVPPVLERAREFIAHILERGQYLPDAAKRDAWRILGEQVSAVLKGGVRVVAPVATAHSYSQTMNAYHFPDGGKRRKE